MIHADTAIHIIIALRLVYKQSSFFIYVHEVSCIKKCEIGTFSYPMRGEYENPHYLTYTIEWNCHFIIKMT